MHTHVEIELREPDSPVFVVFHYPRLSLSDHKNSERKEIKKGKGVKNKRRIHYGYFPNYTSEVDIIFIILYYNVLSELMIFQ